MIGYQDPNHEGNSAKHHTGKPCIEEGCEEPAGTAWSPIWCFKHNVERMGKVTTQMEGISASFSDKSNGGGD